eukprot:TRINITY_DN9708_c0_g1_i10.p1 TRINITY_DN9708_c0_g1~~TRINITY_DN9708_c0_g1_i10.p1  ORF type:complete len:315 (+),score=45.59 TRINITY_DN9708_c0_g1_i10:23-946(+)
MIRRPPRSTHCISSAASDVYKRQGENKLKVHSAQNDKKQVKKRSIEEIVACIDIRDTLVEEDKEFVALRAIANNGITSSETVVIKEQEGLSMGSLLIQSNENVENNFADDINIELKDHVEKILNSPKHLTMLNMFTAIQPLEHNPPNDLALSFPNNDIGEISVRHRRRNKKLSDRKGRIALKEVKELVRIDAEEWIKDNVVENSGVVCRALAIPCDLKSANKSLKVFFKKLTSKAFATRCCPESSEADVANLRREVATQEQLFEPKILSAEPKAEIQLTYTNFHKTNSINSLSIAPPCLNTSQYGNA